MHKLFKVPLAFLFIASCFGLLLRYQLTSPIQGVVYSYVLHTHSHVVLLGWVFNVLIIALTLEYVEIRAFRWLFWFLQCCVAGMLLSFPFQGYGAVSITFSSLHTLGAFVYVVLFFRSAKNQRSVALMLARVALFFLLLSAVGPFLLAYLKATGLDQSNWYRLSIYFYLHFLYNGFFFFGVLSLFMKLLEGSMTDRDIRTITIGSYILIASCVPAYLLSTLWTQPPFIYNIAGFVSAFAQLIGVLCFVRPLAKFFVQPRFPTHEIWLFSLSFSALLLKLILQLISAFPTAAAFSNEFRAIVIAYLHLTLLGFITLFLITWLMRKGVIRYKPWSIGLLLVGFYASELLLIVSPWNGDSFNIPTTIFNQLIFVCSFLMVCGIGFLSFALSPE